MEPNSETVLKSSLKFGRKCVDSSLASGLGVEPQLIETRFIRIYQLPTPYLKDSMASNVVIEDSLMKLDELHSVDYENEEVQLIKTKVETIVECLSRKIAELNPILSNSVVQCGSFYHNSKITAPDEYDYILILNKFSQPSICSCKPFPD